MQTGRETKVSPRITERGEVISGRLALGRQLHAPQLETPVVAHVHRAHVQRVEARLIRGRVLVQRDRAGNRVLERLAELIEQVRVGALLADQPVLAVLVPGTFVYN